MAHREIRVATELLMDTGRRPQEICALPLDCLARDGDGSPVLVYENHKENRLSRRLPVAEATAQVIIAQQQRIRDRFPHQAVGRLALLPTTRANPDGSKPIPIGSLDNAHREWVDSLPVLRTSDGRDFDKARIIPYAYRHSYAQRHADVGVAPDVLRELFYRHRDLLAQVHAREAQPPAQAAGGPAVTRASLQADLLAAHERSARLAARIRQLEHRLSELLGEHAWRESGLGQPDDIGQLKEQVAQLTLDNQQFRNGLAERDQDLAAARAANRELMAHLNSRS
jgi:hypothetical protein